MPIEMKSFERATSRQHHVAIAPPRCAPKRPVAALAQVPDHVGADIAAEPGQRGETIRLKEQGRSFFGGEPFN